ncbi:MAG: nitrophenyl compound nitroreductase subunit ArsF family protein [Phycisphaerae bacterium]|nr:nitrophenyl compound nitroreductase subunit ArsF family protein [Phycisphaerae bacterium]
MVLRLLQIVCLVSAVFYFGCQEQKTPVNSDRILNQQTVNQADKTIVIAYYFHRTFRCPTCRAIEAKAAQVIEKNFAQELADGRLTWMPFNLDDPGGKEFEKEFDISISTLVIAKMKGDNNTEYKKLEKVWELVNDNKGFAEYVTNELNNYLMR